MFSKLKNIAKDKGEELKGKAKDKSEEMIEEHIPKIKVLLKEKVGIKAKDAFENDELMTKALSRVYDLLIISHPTIRFFIKREKLISFGLSNRNRLIDWRDTRSLPPLTEPQPGESESQNIEQDASGMTFNPPQDFMDFEKARIYLGTRTPEQVAIESRKWGCSLTDILAVADVLSMALQADDHAIALYKEGLRELSEHPEKSDPDTNIAFAYASLGQVLIRRNRIEEAIDALYEAVRSGSDHSHIKTLLALNLQNTGRSQEAYQLIEEVFSYPQAKLSEELSPQFLEKAKELRNFLTARHRSQNSPDSEEERPMPRDYIREATSTIFGDKVPLAELLETEPGQVVGNLLRALNYEEGLPSTIIRKGAAYALGQIGYEGTLDDLRERYGREQAPGVKDALVASMTAIKLAPDGEGHSQLERRQIIEDVYNGRRPADWI
ncbi:MAG TPA: HEAT repeat domain-containing protein [Blastocatellia bacterium]|nr:HEAT repeat domain-containing protein [Blastocatellia bacterium]